MVLTRKVAFGIIALAIAGCGGGSGVTPVSNAPHSGSAGMSSFTFTGQMKPLVSAGTGQVTVSGLAGASFSTVFVQPTKSLDSSYLVFSRELNQQNSNLNLALYKAGATTGAVQPLVASPDNCFSPAASATGYIAFSELNDQKAYRMKADGSQLSLISTGEATFLTPAFSPDSTKIAFSTEGFQLFTCPSTGGTSTLIQNNVYPDGVAWTADGSHLIFANENATGYLNLYSTAVTGGTVTDITPTNLQSAGYFFSPACSVDGTTIAGAFEPIGTSLRTIITFSETSGNFVEITPSGYNDNFPCFSPDGKQIAFYRDNSGGASPGIYVSDTAGTNQTLLVPDPTGNGLSGPLEGLAWSPFPADTKFIGSGSGFYTSTANGFLLSQNLNQFASMVAFTVTTPSKATITASSPTGTYQPLIFTLTGDSITKIGWTSNFYNAGATQTPPPGTTSALVTIDAITGGVDLVADAASFKPVGTRTAGGNATYQGKFTAIFDGTGKNLAPQGASQVVVNTKSGKLISFT